MTTAIAGYDTIAVFVGLDVGKSEHHAVALDRAGKKLYDKALPQDEARLRQIIADLSTHGPVLLVVDQPATVGALPVAVARTAGATVGYLPGLAMRRIADLHPGEAKTDARDAAIIAETARTMHHTLRQIAVDDEQVAELTMLCGFDDDLAGQIRSNFDSFQNECSCPAVLRSRDARTGTPSTPACSTAANTAFFVGASTASSRRRTVNGRMMSPY